MIEAIYALCAAASALCALLLWRAYRASRSPLLFWSCLCFMGLALNNLLLLVDLVLLPEAIDLAVTRGLVGLTALSVLIYGLVWELK